MTYLEQMRVLIVEDDTMVREQMVLGLEDFVGEIMVASDGKAGLKAYREANPPIDLVITDLKMPLMGGLEMIEALKTLPHQPKGIIITTAYGETDFFQEAIRLKIDRYLIKPIDLKLLIEALTLLIAPHISTTTLHAPSPVLSLLTLLGGKKVRIVEFLLSKLDHENCFHGTYQSVMEALGISKATVVETFNQLIEAGILERVKNGIYRFNPEYLLFREGERYLKV